MLLGMNRHVPVTLVLGLLAAILFAPPAGAKRKKDGGGHEPPAPKDVPMAELTPVELRGAVEASRDTFRLVDNKEIVQAARIEEAETGRVVASDWDNPAVTSAGPLTRISTTVVAHDFGDIFLTADHKAVELVGIANVTPGMVLKGWGSPDAPYPPVSKPGTVWPRYRWVKVLPAQAPAIEVQIRAKGGFLLTQPLATPCPACRGSGRLEKSGQLKRHCPDCKGSGKEIETDVIRVIR